MAERTVQPSFAKLFSLFSSSAVSRASLLPAYLRYGTTLITMLLSTTGASRSSPCPNAGCCVVKIPAAIKAAPTVIARTELFISGLGSAPYGGGLVTVPRKTNLIWRLFIPRHECLRHEPSKPILLAEKPAKDGG